MTTRRDQLLSYVIHGVFAIVALYPIVSIVLLAFHKRSDLVTGFSIPDSLDFSTFRTAWEEGSFARGLLNSFIVAASVSVVTAVLSTLAAYAFGTMRFRGSELLFYLLLIGLIFPYEATVIPLYYDFQSVPKSSECGIEKPVTRSDRLWKASRTMLMIGYSATSAKTPRIT